MQTLYIADLPLPGDKAAAWEAGESAVDTWAADRLGLELRPDGTQKTDGTRGTLGMSQVLHGSDGSALRVWNTRKVDPTQPVWAYDVSAWLMDDRQHVQDATTLRVRLSAHALHGRVAELPTVPAAPHLVRTLLEQHEIIGDGQRLGAIRALGPGEVPGLVAHMLDETRRRPILVLTPSPTLGTPTIDPGRTAKRLAGLAHVVVLSDRATSSSFALALGGTELSVFGGAARLYWPGFRVTDRRGHHPLWLPDRLAAGGPNRFAELLFARLGRLSALTLGPPALEARLRREAQARRESEDAARAAVLTRQCDDALRELQVLKARPEDLPPQGESLPDEWIAEYERALDELEETAREREELEAEVRLLKGNLKVAEANIRAISLAMAAADQRTTIADDEDDLETIPEPQSVVHAVELAASVCDHLEFLQEAYGSARDSEFRRPQQVLDDLIALNQVAQAWARDELPAAGFEAALVEAGVSGYRSGISQTARKKYAKDYERTYQGKTILLGPHIARGVGAAATILRVYWYEDKDAHVLVVGHVGRKLRDDSNP